ncbi:hypothetical protein E2C01_004588 [Portunus trituberculatus]|uniref:Uncharacterized protein n=1 Tax=Portunus trituberculatus TaxID=210409 RepID=A0A5B7CWT8_PORTR|nr:hypothetical protein [Portunus trituberculatus]
MFVVNCDAVSLLHADSLKSIKTDVVLVIGRAVVVLMPEDQAMTVFCSLHHCKAHHSCPASRAHGIPWNGSENVSHSRLSWFSHFPFNETVTAAAAAASNVVCLAGSRGDDVARLGSL